MHALTWIRDDAMGPGRSPAGRAPIARGIKGKARLRPCVKVFHIPGNGPSRRMTGRKPPYIVAGVLPAAIVPNYGTIPAEGAR
jgi:hypothetical protein